MRLTVEAVGLFLGLLIGVVLKSHSVSAATVALGETHRLKNVLVQRRSTVGLVPRKSMLFAGPRQAYEDEYLDYEDEEEDEQAEEEFQAALSETGEESVAGGEQDEEEEDDEGGDEEEDGENDEDEERQLKRKYLIRNFLGITI